MHCWNILKNEAKWSDKMVEINTTGNATRVNQRFANGETGSPNQAEFLETGEHARPEGRDSAKKKRARPTVDTSASSTAIEVLQRMNERSQIKDDKEDSQMAQILQRKDAKIELQQNMIALQREEMEKRWELEKEKISLHIPDQPVGQFSHSQCIQSMLPIIPGNPLASLCLRITSSSLGFGGLRYSPP